MVLKKTRDAAKAARTKRTTHQKPKPKAPPATKGAVARPRPKADPPPANLPTIGPLNGRGRVYLRGLGHHLDPVIQVGTGGISEAVLAETDRALEHHELIKLKFGRGAEGDASSLTATLAARAGAQVVQVIGRVALIFRQNTVVSKRKIAIPKGRAKPS